MGALTGTAALVTGGAGGIGFATAHALGADGAAVTIMGRTSATLEQATERLRTLLGTEAHVAYAVGDATDASDVEMAMNATAARGDTGLATVVAVVGGSVVRPLLEFDEDAFATQLRDNVLPTFLAIRTATPHLAARGGGSIVCISSVVAVLPYAMLTPYGSAKAAVEGLTRGAALELAPLGIRVNAIRPGPVRTGAATAHLGSNSPSVQRHIASRPLGRVGDPNDIAAAVRYLAGPDASWITGQCFSVDGGTELAGAPTYLQSLVSKRS